jgi:hypothetical protein
MSNLKDLVPPLELCKKIPTGEFAESALLWRVPNCSFPLEDEFYEIHKRDKCESWMKDKQIPSPTLQEIMAELTACDCYRFTDKNEWTVLLVNAPVDDGVKSNNPATAALKLWLKLKGIEA